MLFPARATRERRATSGRWLAADSRKLRENQVKAKDGITGSMRDLREFVDFGPDLALPISGKATNTGLRARPPDLPDPSLFRCELRSRSPQPA